jgi:hypothetical protein
MKKYFINLIKSNKAKNRLTNKKLKRSLKFDIDNEYLTYLYHKQMRECIYTGDKLKFNKGINRTCISRINIKKGYTEDNVQLSTWKAHHIRSALLPIFSNTIESIQLFRNGPIVYEHDYTKFNNIQRGFVMNLLITCKKNCKIRAQKNRVSSSRYNISLGYIEQLYNEQDRKCAYSGIKLSFNKTEKHKLSIDRIDSNKGYTTDNVHLVSWAINQAKGNMDEIDFLDSIHKIYYNLF